MITLARQFRTSSALVLCAALVTGWALNVAAQEQAQGVVYHDRNGNRVLDDGEEGVPGVGVSNGVDIVETDDAGRYDIALSNDSIIFVIKPANWRTAIDEDNLPRFYYIHKPEGSPDTKYDGVAPTGGLPASVDFPLYPQNEPEKFRAIMFGDPQPRNVEEVNYIAHDVVEELIGFGAAFGVTLGDIVFDDLTVFPVLNGVIGRIGAPWYNVIGNHDLNFDVDTDEQSDETFERVYGPAYYSFNYAKAHFIIIDNVVWDGDGYHGEIGRRQLTFIQNDLARVPQDRLVVAMMHIPLVSVDDKAELIRILSARRHSFSISAHWHRQGHYFMSEESDELGDHHHLVHGTISGSWWSGLKDEFGIPHTMMRDGTPNGYSIATFDGTKYSLRYKAARRPKDFQLSIFAPEEVTPGNAHEAEVVVNVFMGSSQSEVEMRFGETGEWRAMKPATRVDPYYQDLKEREYYLPRAAGRPLPNTGDSTHLWVANLPERPDVGTYVIYVRTADMFGQVHHGRRVIRVE